MRVMGAINDGMSPAEAVRVFGVRPDLIATGSAAEKQTAPRVCARAGRAANPVSTPSSPLPGNRPWPGHSWSTSPKSRGWAAPCGRAFPPSPRVVAVKMAAASIWRSRCR